MKASRRTLALLLALALLCSVALAGCGERTEAQIAGPDEVAAALFDLIIRGDASAIQKALGYESEEDARADFMGTEGDFYATLTDELVGQFEEMGFTVSSEDGARLLEAILTMMGKVDFTAEVKELDEKAGTAVVTAHVSAFAPDALSGAITEAAMGLELSDDLADDQNALVSALIQAMADAIESVEPSGETVDFDSDFSLQRATINGSVQRVWLPVDAEAFGNAISTAALGG